MSDRLLVPYDGSEPSKQALEYALETFPDSDVTAQYVIPAPEGYWAVFEASEDRVPGGDEAKERGRSLLDDAAVLAADHGHEIRTELTSGTADREIVRVAETEDFDAIVIGSHGRDGVSRALLGSVAEKVVRRSGVPVLVVR
ncbi:MULTISPECIES: universal stress protein [Natrialba]|uniref:Universal stress protein n=1 Tax=Natrialba swarupiae TaxID=2448032 RepID=A0A5D5AHP1_9EURY|nr:MULTISPECIES: universal stress protein [Natrialba]MWV38279.1 universal stress protein [Natrialba sp. INN-245]TYT61309.1 universal stress protein [Natrialba swarupiae]